MMVRQRALRAAGAIAISAALAAGGCKRSPSANAPPTTTGTAKADDAQAVLDVAPPKPADPAHDLFLAIRISPNEKKVRQIIAQCPDLLNKPINGVRPLWMACESRSLPVVKALVEAGANLKAVNDDHKTILWPAVNYDDMTTVKYLIEKGADPKALQENGKTLLWAAETKQMAQFLIDAGVDPKRKDTTGDTALHLACRHSLLDMVELLLDKGLDIEAKGHWDMRPLHCAASTITGDPRPVVYLLLRRGADIDSRGFQGHTALHECALYNREEMADLLLSRGAQPDLKDDEGRTPIDTAMLAGKIERVKLINMLIKRGAPGELIPVSKD